MLTASINPVTVFPDTAVYLTVYNAAVTSFGDSGMAILCWQLLDVNGKVLRQDAIEISGADYQGWNDDDPYLLYIVLNKLGLTRA